MANDDLTKRFKEFLEISPPFVAGQGQGDAKVVNAIGALGLAIEKLDRTSSFLAWVNIGVGAIVVAIGILQVCLMLRGR